MGDSTNLHIPTGLAPYERCIIYPVVVFNILDHYIRRSESSDRVIGTLLGVINDDDVVEIRNCFPVTHKDDNEGKVSIDADQHFNISNLYQKVNQEEYVVGWYATGNGIRGSTPLINKFYEKAMKQQPVHLVVDTDLSKGKINVDVFYSISIALQEKRIQDRYISIPYEYLVNEQDRIAMQLLETSNEGKTIISDNQNMDKNLLGLSNTLAQVLDYVNRVIEGTEKPNKEIGRFLRYTLSLIPNTGSTHEKSIDQALQDTTTLVKLMNQLKPSLNETEKSKE